MEAPLNPPIQDNYKNNGSQDKQDHIANLPDNIQANPKNH